MLDQVGKGNKLKTIDKNNDPNLFKLAEKTTYVGHSIKYKPSEHQWCGGILKTEFEGHFHTRKQEFQITSTYKEQQRAEDSGTLSFKC